MSSAETSPSVLYDEEPHATRRKKILAAHPEIKTLMKPDSRVALQIGFMFVVQLGFAAQCKNFSWPVYLLVLYCIGGTLNHSLSLGMHELSHFTAFGYHSKWMHLASVLVCNFPLSVPAYFTFRKYHLDHHRYLGDEQLDTDIPSNLEIKVYKSKLGKFLFVMFQPLSYCFRPIFVNPKRILASEVFMFLAQLTFDFIVYRFLGMSALLYLFMSTCVGLSLHPISGHFISEHYIFIKGVETYSYYGPLNWITFNVGYHNEHHDFPSIAGFRLPQVKKMAPEFYDDLPCHNSWVQVLYDFITMPDITLESRLKRPTKIAQINELKSD